MAERRSTTVIDDITGEEGATTVKFALDGDDYEIDLTPQRADEFRQSFAEYITAGRRLPRNGQAKKVRANGNGGGTDRERTAAIRQWAREQGMEVNERGRIPSRVVEAYEAASA